MITYKKHKGVTSYVKRSSRFNRKELDLEKCKSSQPESFNAKKRTFVDLFTNGPLLFQLFSHCIIMIVMNFTYWALSLFSTDLHENEMIGYFLSGFVELPAAGTVFLLAYFGRRTVTGWSLLAQSALMFIAVFYPGRNAVAMTLFLSVKLFNSVSWVAEPLLVGEMSPTTTRNMFYGVVGFVGEIGSIIAPYFNRLKTIHDAAPAFAVALLSLLAGLLALCSPETKDMPMPEDINDFDPGPVYRWIFGSKSNKLESNNENDKNIVPLLDPIPEEPTEFEK
uniref:Organic cation transporter n=1 Tax=Panagrolaimus sp. JU765 TaxID=591449 RepID=A0AC34QDJ6_9BILA